MCNLCSEPSATVGRHYLRKGGSHWCEVGATSREDMKGVAVASDPWHSVPCLCVHILFVSVYSVWNAWCAGVWVSGLVEGTHEGRDGLVTHAAHPPLHVRPPWFSKVFGGRELRYILSTIHFELCLNLWYMILKMDAHFGRWHGPVEQKTNNFDLER